MSFEFEGDEVTDFTAQLPSAVLQAPDAYQRGTLLTLQVQVRVKSVRIEEDRKGNLSRKHILALEDVTVTDVLTPAQRQALIDEAERQAQLIENGGTIAEAAEITDAPEVHDDGPTAEDEALNESISELLGTDVNEDDDPEHAWMDEEEEQGVHTDLSALV